MQDVYFLDWSVAPGAVLALKQQVGNIETSKAVSDLFAPIAGTLSAINPDVLRDPSTINVDGYGRGWLFEMAGDLAGTLSAARVPRLPGRQLGPDAADPQGPDGRVAPGVDFGPGREKLTVCRFRPCTPRIAMPSQRRDRDDDFDDDRPARRRPRDEYDCAGRLRRRPGRARRGPVSKGVNVCGLIALIMGIVGLIFALIPCIGVIGIPIAAIGLLLGLIGLMTAGKTTGRGLPIAGTCVSLAGLLIGGGWLLFFVYASKKSQDRIEVMQKEMEAQAKVAQEQARAADEEKKKKERELREGPAITVTADKLYEEYDANPLTPTPSTRAKSWRCPGPSSGWTGTTSAGSRSSWTRPATA